MSTTSLALLKGANKAALEQQLSETTKETPVEKEAVQDEAVTEEAITVEDINKMTGVQIEALIKENEVSVPDTWKKMTVPAKKTWLIAQMTEAPAADETAAEEAAPEQEEAAPADEEQTEPEVVEKQAVEEPAPEPAKAAVKKTTTQPAKKTANVTGKVGTAIVGVQTVSGEIILPDAISDIAFELTNLKEKDARDVARKLLEAGEQTYIKVGIVLAHIQDNGWYTPYSNFKDFVVAEYGIEYRKAMYLVRIANDIIASGIPYEKVAPIGWGKLKDISSVITVDNVDHWVEVALKNNQIQLQQIVAESKKSGTALPSAATVEVSTKTFKLHKDQKEEVEEALTKAKQTSGTAVDSVALAWICNDYLNNGNAKAFKPTTEQVRKAIEDMGAEKAAELVQSAFPDLNFALEV